MLYFLREGNSNRYKFGFTRNTVVSRAGGLQTGNSQTLTPVCEISTSNDSAYEKLFKNLHASKMVRKGGTEFFELEEGDINKLIGEFKQLVEDSEAAKTAVQQLSNEKSNGNIINPSPEDHTIYQRLLANKAEQLEHQEQLTKLQAEQELLENCLKQRIGCSSELKGIATWQTKLGNRNFNEARFKTENPALYAKVYEVFQCLDTASWRKERLKEYNTVKDLYFTQSEKREFKLQ
jgi:hypothetical protein